MMLLFVVKIVHLLLVEINITRCLWSTLYTSAQTYDPVVLWLKNSTFTISRKYYYTVFVVNIVY